jgi:hypothetical protein
LIRRSVPTPLDKSLTLLVPGLFGPPGDRLTVSGPAPALETLLSRADNAIEPMPGFEQLVFSLFGIEPPKEGDLPVAAVTRALDMGVIDNDWWLRADPVHLRPERDRLVLFDTQFVEIRQEDATRLAADISRAYAADGWVLKAPRPGRWYLKPPRAARITTTPLSEVAGKDIHPYLPKGTDGKAWHTVLSEMQILLHTASVNAERESRGELPINSLWFWGSGRLPDIRAVPWSQVYSEEPLSLALARLSETPSHAPPGGYADWRRQATAAGSNLIVLAQARAAVQYGDVSRWQKFLVHLERDWIAPSMQALKRRELARLTLYTDTGRAFDLTAGAARRWWRRRRPLASFR